MGKQVDLDAARQARREAEGEAPVVVFGGKSFELPVEMPFTFVEATAEYNRASKAEDGTAASGVLADMVRAVFGSQYSEFMSLNPSVKDIEELMSGVAGMYGTDQGESPASEN